MRTLTLTNHNGETDRQHMARKQQDKLVYQRKPRKCPECGAKQIAEYLFGMVDYPGIEQDLAEGKIAIGGCDISRMWEGELERAWRCNQCGVDLFRKDQAQNRCGTRYTGRTVEGG